MSAQWPRLGTADLEHAEFNKPDLWLYTSRYYLYELVDFTTAILP
jgi:hypothetical protein